MATFSDQRHTTCRYFTGYKPCSRNSECSAQCPKLEVRKESIIIIHLGALGAVLRSTSLLPAIKRKYPNCHLTWVTQEPADKLLHNHPDIDRLIKFNLKGVLSLQALEFSAGICIDKSLEATGLFASVKVKERFGFGVDPGTGGILPLTASAKELWEIGLSNSKKFYNNRKPETQLMIEAFELGPYKRDPYSLNLNPSEAIEIEKRKFEWSQSGSIVGINTGCSPIIAAKKMTIELHIALIEKITDLGLTCVLLGGREDADRNFKIFNHFKKHKINLVLSPTHLGLRDGIISIAACDIIVSGDSLGMHLGIALKKWVVAWFGPTCEQEIDLFDQGEKVLANVNCQPCWKRICNKEKICSNHVPLDNLMAAIKSGLKSHIELVKTKTSSLDNPNIPNRFDHISRKYNAES